MAVVATQRFYKIRLRHSQCSTLAGPVDVFVVFPDLYICFVWSLSLLALPPFRWLSYSEVVQCSAK